MSRISYFLMAGIFLLSCNSPKTEPTAQKEVKREVKEVVEYYPDGKKKIEGKEVNGERHGIWKYYYENGFLWSEGEYKYGVRKGYSIVYYKSGKKKMEGVYQNDLKVGIWKLWNEDGSLNREVNMDDYLSKEDSLKLSL